MHLVLIRHAKSSWDDPSLIDHQRPLSGRGLRVAPAMGEVLAKKLPPDASPFVLCSTARRTAHTLELLGLSLPVAPDAVVYSHGLYEARPEDALAISTAIIPPSTRWALIIGHEPCLSGLCSLLGATPPAHFPTCAALCLHLSAPLGSAPKATPEWFLAPKALGIR